MTIKNLYDPQTDTRFIQKESGVYTLSDEKNKIGIIKDSSSIQFVTQTHIAKINLENRIVEFLERNSCKSKPHSGDSKTVELKTKPIRHQRNLLYDGTIVYWRRENSCPHIKIYPNDDVIVSANGWDPSSSCIVPTVLTLKLTNKSITCAKAPNYGIRPNSTHTPLNFTLFERLGVHEVLKTHEVVSGFFQNGVLSPAVGKKRVSPTEVSEFSEFTNESPSPPPLAKKPKRSESQATVTEQDIDDYFESLVK